MKGRSTGAPALHWLAGMDEYIAVMKTLPFEERKKVYAYSAAVAERCGKHESR